MNRREQEVILSASWRKASKPECQNDFGSKRKRDADTGNPNDGGWCPSRFVVLRPSRMSQAHLSGSDSPGRSDSQAWRSTIIIEGLMHTNLEPPRPPSTTRVETRAYVDPVSKQPPKGKSCLSALFRTGLLIVYDVTAPIRAADSWCARPTSSKALCCASAS